jgi:hypothetical protein
VPLNNGDTLGRFHPIGRNEIAAVYRLACQ